MGPKKSQIWIHFSEETEGKVKCLYCRQLLSIKNKSTSTLIRHMNHKHPTLPINKRTVAEAPAEEIKFSLVQQLSQLPEASWTTSTTKRFQPSTFSDAGKSQTIICQKSHSITKQKEIDKQLISMITKEYHPFSIVEDKEFKRMVYLLNPNYKVPTRKTVSNSMIPAFYNDTVDLVKCRLNRAFAVCLTTEALTSRTNDNFYSVTAHYIVEEDSNTFLSSDLLGCISYTERHTAENISTKLREVIDEWKLTNKIEAVVSDNETDMKAAVRIGGWPFWGCFAQSLNLVAQSGLSEIKEIVDKIKAIVSYFKRSSHAFSQLKVSAERMDISPLKLKNEVATCWNSTYDMINRVLKMKNAIISTLAILSTSSHRNQQDDSELITQLHNEEWIIAEQAIEALEIFNLVTIAISSERSVSASTIIFYYKQITKHLNSINTVMPQIENMVKKLKLEIQNCFQDIEENDVIAQATILDPRYKKFGFIDEKKYKQAVENLYIKVASATLFDGNREIKDDDVTENEVEQGNQNIASEKDLFECLWDDFDVEVRKHLKPSNPTASAVIEVNKYLDESILPRKDNSGVYQDPLVWWHQRKHIYPKLYQIMKTRLCVMATSVPCERIFSKAGQIIKEKRERLKTDKICQVIFLNYNLNNKN